MDEIDSRYPVLDALKDTMVNVDQLDYLAKRLDSFGDEEAAQFQAMARKLEIAHIKDFINLTFCCQQATVITDFSDLEKIGKDHVVTLNGGMMPLDRYQTVDGRKEALQLIEGGGGTITPFGVVYDNGTNVFADGPVGALPTPTCDWSAFPEVKVPAVEVRHFAHDTGDSMFIRNIYETRRMQYTIYNALGKEPSAWKNGRPLASVALTIAPEDEPYTQTFWPWRSSELEKLVHSRPNSRYCVEAWDYYSKGVFQYTRYRREEKSGAPARAQRSGSRGERSRSEMSELSPSGVSEGYGACGDDGHLKQIEKRIRDCGFHVRMADEQDIKRLLAVYYQQDVTTEHFNSFDGEGSVNG